MADRSAIEWTDATWSPTTGCDRVSPGCNNCYALTLAKRLKAMGSPKYQTDGDPRTSGPGFGIAVHDSALTVPLRWQKPRRIFVNAMSDLFHDGVPDAFLHKVFAVMALTPQHTYQILTKRHGRMRSFLNDVCQCGGGHVPGIHLRSHITDEARFLKPGYAATTSEDVYYARPWPLPNVWMGVSAEDQERANLRVHALLATPAAVRFVSAEPLLGPIDFRNLDAGRGRYIDALYGDVKTAAGEVYAACPGALDWVITGGESGQSYRPAQADWFRSIRDQCAATRTAFLHKQNGGRTPKSGGRELDGLTHDGYPAVA